MIKRSPMLMLATVCLLTGLAAPVLFAAEETIERTMSIRADGLLEVDNINGSVRVHAWDQHEVKMKAVKRVKGEGAKAYEKLDLWEIEIDESPGRIRITTIKPPKSKYNYRNGVSIKYELWVPGSVSLELKTTNGNIDVEDMQSEVMAKSTNGNIKIGRISGPVQARVTNGNIAVKQAVGSVNATTTNGSIRADLLEHNGEAMRLHTTNGGIYLGMPREIRVDVEARTTNGSIKSDLPITISGAISKRKLNGVINGGGPLLELKTTNGSITLNEI